LTRGAVRGRGGPAGEPRQDLIVATVVCPNLPRIPWQHFFSGVRFFLAPIWIAETIRAPHGGSIP
jgi:hypothetical protein